LRPAPRHIAAPAIGSLLKRRPLARQSDERRRALIVVARQSDFCFFGFLDAGGADAELTGVGEVGEAEAAGAVGLMLLPEDHSSSGPAKACHTRIRRSNARRMPKLSSGWRRRSSPSTAMARVAGAAARRPISRRAGLIAAGRAGPSSGTAPAPGNCTVLWL
jgi:hypothetical protein